MKLLAVLITSAVVTFATLSPAATISVTTDSPTGPGSLTAAINALNHGDTIAFHIPPEGGEVHYLLTPPDGYPIITKNNITVDGYTQGGASPNTASIHAANNAQLRIVLSSTNNNGLPMNYAWTNATGVPMPRGDWGNDEIAILAFIHATNAHVRGICFQSNPWGTNSFQGPDPVGGPPTGDSPKMKAICFAAVNPSNGGGKCENFHVSGCWFGIDPTTRLLAFCNDNLYGVGTVIASPKICVASYRQRDASGSGVTYNWPGTLGVAAGSANPRAEFNLWITGYGFDAEGLNYRVSGNWFNVLPDGTSGVDLSIQSPDQQEDGFLEIGRNTSNFTIGTDGDGVNDADEGNIFGPLAGAGVCMDFYSDPRTNMVIAGNYFGVDINLKPFGPDPYGNPLVDSLGNLSSCRFGSDFNGVSDALEANVVTNGSLPAHGIPGAPTNGTWISMRGNTLLNTTSASGTRPPLGDGQSTADGQNVYGGFIDISSSTFDIIPVIGLSTTTTTLAGTCGKPLAGSPFTRLIVDLYEADPTPSVEPQGKTWLGAYTDNSPADGNPAVGAFSFNTAGLGLTSGKKVTITVTYSKDTNPTISSVSRVGNQTTINVTGGTGPGPVVTYGIYKSSTVTGPYVFAAAAVGGSVTFTDNNSPSFYRATGPSATGQTSPFSDVFTIP